MSAIVDPWKVDKTLIQVWVNPEDKELIRNVGDGVLKRGLLAILEDYKKYMKTVTRKKRPTTLLRKRR